MIKRHVGTVAGGKFIPDDRGSFVMAFCPHEGKRVVVTVDRDRKRRSNEQNRYYWGVVLKLIADVTGYTTDESHEAMRWEHLRKRKDGMPDTTHKTSDLNTAEMEEYLTHVREWAAVKLGCYIPLPNEVVF